MKKLLLILLCLPIIGFGQNTYVPDDNFEAYLENSGMGDGIAFNDSVLTSNINSQTFVYLFNSSISDLTGIEDFISLEHLDCTQNQLTSLDLSNNHSLITLDCSGNFISNLDISNAIALTTLKCTGNQLTSLDVSNNNFLTELVCNGNQLTSLDVSNNNFLTDLTCNYNLLTSLDVNGADSLNFLFCNNNLLTSLDVNLNTLLERLDCYNNLLTSLDVSNNINLEALFCEFNQLTSLDVSNNALLADLNCSFNQLTTLDASGADSLRNFSCEGNLLTNLNVSNNLILRRLKCVNNQLISLDLSNNTALFWVFCYNNQLTSLNLSNHSLHNQFDLLTYNNANLLCIDVDDPLLAQSLVDFWPFSFNIDPWTSFDTNCSIALGCMDSLACNYSSLATINDGSCSYIPVYINTDSVTCSNFYDASLTVSFITGSYNFLWSNGQTTQSIDSLTVGSYSVIITDTTGCSVTFNTNVSLATPPALNMSPEICYVSVDSSSGKNIVVVKQMGNLLTSKFIIYKESSANIYSPLDTINNNVLEYLDVSSNPMSQSYRYKVSVLDTCGNESSKSNFHNTIHLTMNLGINGEINLLWNAYEGYQPSNYLIFRSINNGSMNQVGILSGTNLTYTDLTPPSGILNYQVRAIAPNCNIIPFAKNSTSMLVSNVINHSTTAVNELVNSKKVIKVTDLLGRETKQTNKPLFYIYDDGTVEKRIVIE
jgi:hypothetical protein